mgnify:CR=1 FL=1
MGQKSTHPVLEESQAERDASRDDLHYNSIKTGIPTIFIRLFDEILILHSIYFQSWSKFV